MSDPTHPDARALVECPQTRGQVAAFPAPCSLCGGSAAQHPLGSADTPALIEAEQLCANLACRSDGVTYSECCRRIATALTAARAAGRREGREEAIAVMRQHVYATGLVESMARSIRSLDPDAEA